jgi:hypothetical protein
VCKVLAGCEEGHLTGIILKILDIRISVPNLQRLLSILTQLRHHLCHCF